MILQKKMACNKFTFKTVGIQFQKIVKGNKSAYVILSKNDRLYITVKCFIQNKFPSSLLNPFLILQMS